MGRPRYVASGLWHGGAIVREAKAQVPSSWDWAAGREEAAPLFLNLATGRNRSADPFLNLRSGYIIRRIAPDSQKLDTTDPAVKADSLVWLSAMGRDLAASHLGDPTVAKSLDADSRGRKPNWLVDGTEVALRQVQKDYKIWREHRDGKP